MKSRYLVTLVRVLIAGGVSAGPAHAIAGLFFSEYVEGSSYNKALEIYNGTGAPIDLAAEGYEVAIYFNGATVPGTVIPLTGSVPAHGVYVLAHSSADPALVIPRASQTAGGLNFNGDDAVALRKYGILIDVIGQIGVDPGLEWGTGTTTTKDHTLRRKFSVTVGDPNGGDPFDPAAEWEGFPIDTFEGLGQYLPMLSVEVTTTNTLVIWWPLVGFGDWVLEYTTNLNVGGSAWVEIPPPYQTNGTDLQYTEPASVGTRFYRLHKP